MGKTHKSGECLKTLVTLALPLFKQAEKENPRTGRGAKPKVAEWFMGVLIMIAVLKKKKAKSAQYCYLEEHKEEIAAWTRVELFPARATYCRRYRRAHKLYRAAIRLQGEQAIAEGIVDPHDVAIDKSLLGALGDVWHVSAQRAGTVPAGIDTEAAWGYSEYHDWVYGYSFEVAVTATYGDAAVFPLLASVDVASASEVKSGLEKLQQLPEGVVNVLADSGYDANRLGEEVEYDADGNKTGRHYLCPENPRHNSRKKTKRGGADKSRAESRRRRGERRVYFKSKKGTTLYRRRMTTVEPFNQRLKSTFELDSTVWHRGLPNNQTQILAAIFAYQLLLRYNHREGNALGHVRCILDRL